MGPRRFLALLLLLLENELALSYPAPPHKSVAFSVVSGDEKRSLVRRQKLLVHLERDFLTLKNSLRLLMLHIFIANP